MACSNDKADAIIELCRDAALHIYATRPPSAAYAEAAARLLAGTAATESQLAAVRQRNFSYSTSSGAWGLWQTERDSVDRGLSQLAAYDALRARAINWLYGGLPDGWDAWRGMGTDAALRVIAAWPRAACLFARLHYYRWSEPIPFSDLARAKYYKTYYNGPGKGSVEKYLRDYEQLIVPTLNKPSGTS